MVRGGGLESANPGLYCRLFAARIKSPAQIPFPSPVSLTVVGHRKGLEKRGIGEGSGVVYVGIYVLSTQFAHGDNWRRTRSKSGYNDKAMPDAKGKLAG